ncbi:MAG: cytochrome-c oxidase, cbb3-type subunit III [Alphaproteobacteria bacterium]
MSDVDRDEVTGTDTTGHEWDGIKELNTPLPRWWLWTFYATVIWAIGYMVLYPAWPLIESATPGVLGWSSRAELTQEVATAYEEQGELRQAIEASSLEEIRSDQDLLQFAVAGGRSAYAVNCVQCHGSGAAGDVGYPNLNDDAWLWGGTLDDIYFTLKHGIRFEQDFDTRFSEMPAFGRDELLDDEQINDVSDYVLSLSGLEHDPAAATRGQAVYQQECVICHGESGGGDRTQGAPALNDAIWLHGGDKETIVDVVTNSRRGVMPAWGHRLDDATIKKLTIYVHALGGGEQTAPAEPLAGGE